MKALIGIVMGLVVLGVGAAVASPQPAAQDMAQLREVLHDLDRIAKEIDSYALGRCGIFHPPDTGLRREAGEEIPWTLEWDRERFRPLAASIDRYAENWSLLIGQYSELNEIPPDRYGAGGPYGYIGFSWHLKLPNVGILHSVGPNGRPDADLTAIRARLAEKLAGRMNPDPDDYELLLREVEPYQWNPANGFDSGGDILVVIVGGIRVTSPNDVRNWYNAKTANLRLRGGFKEEHERWVVVPSEVPPTNAILASECMEVSFRKPEEMARLTGSFGRSTRTFFDAPYILTTDEIKAIMDSREYRSFHYRTISSSMRSAPLFSGVPVDRPHFFEYMPAIGKAIIMEAAFDIARSRTFLATNRLNYLDGLLAVAEGSHQDYLEHEEWVFAELRRISRQTRALIQEEADRVTGN